MRQTFTMGSLLAGVAAILVVPAISARSARRAAKPPAPAAAADPAPVIEPSVSAFPRALEPAAAFARRGDWEQALVSLATADGSSARFLALRDTLAAEALTRVGELEQAEAAATRAIAAADPDEPELAARAAFIAAEARESAGDPAAAEALFARAAESGTPILARQAALRRGELLAAADPSAALAVLGPLADEPGAGPSLLAQASRAATAAGRDDLALGWLRRLRSEHPASAEAIATSTSPLLKDEARVALRDGRATELLDRADALLEAGQERLAAPDIEAALAAGVEKSLAPRLELLAGRLERMRGQNAKALVHLTRAAAAKDSVGCRAAIHAARASASLRRRGDAAKWTARAASGCPCEWRDRAAQQLAQDAEEDGKLDAARAQWTKLAATGSTPETRRQAAWSLGWSAWTSGRKDEALAAFAALQQAAPESREAAGARYWSARRLRERGDSEGARTALASLALDFPRDWYGVLAADEAGIELPPPPECGEDDVRSALLGAAAALAGGGRPARALLDVEEIGLVEDALAEADAAPGDALSRAAFRALTLSRAGRSREALREFRRAVPDWRRRAEVPAALACAAWPVEHEELIRACCRSQGLTPELVFGLVHQESVFDAAAVSHAGARGLMQIMPSTGQTIAKWLGERVTTAKLLEPSVNVRYGTTYLKRLLDESGRVEVALAGYNAGPGRARRWWAASGNDVALFVENIPFDETRDYVKAITVNERLYRCRLAGGGLPSAGQ